MVKTLSAVLEPEVDAVPDETVDEFQLEQAVEAASKDLEDNAYAMSIEISWFSQSRAASSDEKDEIANKEDGPARDMLSLSFKTVDVKNEYVKKMNECRNAITAFRDSMSIPVAQIAMTGQVEDAEGKKIDSAKDAKEFLNKEAGKRIIMQADIEKFEQQLQTILIPNLMEAVAEANAHIHEIKAASKQKLKGKFREENFPKQFSVGVRGPHYSKLGLDADFETLCPTAAARMKTVMAQQFTDTVNLAITDFATDFLKVIDLAVKQLTVKECIRPPHASPYKSMYGGIIEQVITHEDDEEIPEGSKSFEVSVREGKETVIKQIGPLTEEEIKQQLRPGTSQEKGKVYASTFDTLIYNFKRFDTIRQMLGDAAAPLEEVVSKVQSQLNADNINNGDELAKKLKQSNWLRNQTAASLDEMAVALAGMNAKTSTGSKPKKRKRAFISVS